MILLITAIVSLSVIYFIDMNPESRVSWSEPPTMNYYGDDKIANAYRQALEKQ